MLMCTQELVTRCEEQVAVHERYQAQFDLCREWLVGLREKLVAASDLSGDKHAVQNRLSRLQVRQSSR